MDPNNPIRRFLRAPLTAPVAWILNLATSAVYFRKSTHPVLAFVVFGSAILVLLVMLLAAARHRDQKGLQRVTEYAALCFIVESSLLMLS